MGKAKASGAGWGLFITFEGPEGSGKSTQAEALYRYLREKGHPVLLTREPGGTPIGEQIRHVLLSPQNREMLPLTEALLFSASRAQIVGQLIRPHLERGYIVLCDRYADSTLAYQGYGQGLSLRMLKAITRFATGGLVPDLTVYLDLEVEEGLRRKEGGELDRLDRKETAFHKRVRRGYLRLAAAEPQRWLVLDATRSPAELQALIREKVEALIRARWGEAVEEEDR